VVPKASCQYIEFLLFALQSHDLASLGADSAVPGLNRNMAYLSDQILPSRPLLELFSRSVAGLQRRMHSLTCEAVTLAALRDTLLPKLISGQLRLEHPERFLRGGD
jgi:type I restriction enzyme S subunit